MSERSEPSLVNGKRPDPGQAESGGAHRCNADALGLDAGSDQVWPEDCECADLLNGFQRFAPDVVIVQAAPFGLTCCRVPNLDRDNAVTLLERYRRAEESAVMKLNAPTAIATATAIPAPPTSARPGYLTSIRTPDTAVAWRARTARRPARVSAQEDSLLPQLPWPRLLD